MNTLEKFHIYRLKKLDLHFNETFTDSTNPTFETLLERTVPSSSHAIQQK
jgi:hypothetical protein